MSITVKIEGMDELEAKLGKITAHKFIQSQLMDPGAKELIDHTAAYPPAPKYGGRSWYERGKGGFYRRKDGSVMGPNPPSQHMNKSWKYVPHGDTDVMITNSATYSGYVHDKEHQVGFHAARGWLTIQDMWQKYGPDIVRKIGDAIRDIWRS
jgi:hypothetical protein